MITQYGQNTGGRQAVTHPCLGLRGHYSSRFSQACCFFAFNSLDFSLFLVVLSIRFRYRSIGVSMAKDEQPAVDLLLVSGTLSTPASDRCTRP